ncbi:hypothetical protein D3C86_1620190 [compost metagenome]
MFDNGNLSRLESDMFHFDERMDCFLCSDEVAILEKNSFEQIFDYNTHYQALTQDAIERLEELGFLEGFEELANACIADRRKARKLATIIQNVDLQTLDFDRLRAVVEEWGVDVTVDEQSRTVVAERMRTWSLLKLLADDFLRSPLTNSRYEAQSKRTTGR